MQGTSHRHLHTCDVKCNIVDNRDRDIVRILIHNYILTTNINTLPRLYRIPENIFIGILRTFIPQNQPCLALPFGCQNSAGIVHNKFANPVICNNRVFSRFKLYIIYNLAFKKIFVKDICIQQNVVGILNIHY